MADPAAGGPGPAAAVANLATAGGGKMVRCVGRGLLLGFRGYKHLDAGRAKGGA